VISVKRFEWHAGDPQWFVDAAECTPDSLSLRANSTIKAKQDEQVTAAISEDSDALEALEPLQGSVDEDEAGVGEAEPGTCSAVPNPAVAAIITLGSPQRPPSGGT
jgi:hypothetical protein